MKKWFCQSKGGSAAAGPEHSKQHINQLIGKDIYEIYASLVTPLHFDDLCSYEDVICKNYMTVWE